MKTNTLLKLIIMVLLLIIVFITVHSANAVNGVFVQGHDMYKVDFKILKQNNITEIYIYSGAVGLYGNNKVSDWITKAHKEGIKVNIVVPVFQENNIWHNPTDQNYKNKKLSEIDRYIKLGVDGINLDYIRYSGNAYKYSGASNLITAFVKVVHEKTKPKGIKLSLCIMPEPQNGVKYYGQDIKELSKNCEELSVMIYKGNYKKNSKWILQTTKWYVNNSYCKVRPILQAYRSDNNLTLLNDHELSQDSWSCYNSGAESVAYFQFSYLNLFPINKYANGNDIIKNQNTITTNNNESDFITQLNNDLNNLKFVMEV